MTNILNKPLKTPTSYYGGKQNLVTTILPLIPNVGQNTTLKYFEKLLEKILISDYCSNKTFDIILQSYSNIATNAVTTCSKI